LEARIPFERPGVRRTARTAPLDTWRVTRPGDGGRVDGKTDPRSIPRLPPPRTSPSPTHLQRPQPVTRTRRRRGPRSPPTPRFTGLSQIKAASGLRSVARNNKATRLRTRPGRSTKSSAKDLSLRTVKLQSASREASLRETPHRRPAVVLGRSLFVSDCGVQGRITPFRHGF
jgi:hypothetical protein